MAGKPSHEQLPPQSSSSLPNLENRVTKWLQDCEMFSVDYEVATMCGKISNLLNEEENPATAIRDGTCSYGTILISHIADTARSSYFMQYILWTIEAMRLIHLVLDLDVHDKVDATVCLPFVFRIEALMEGQVPKLHSAKKAAEQFDYDDFYSKKHDELNQAASHYDVFSVSKRLLLRGAKYQYPLKPKSSSSSNVISNSTSTSSSTCTAQHNCDDECARCATAEDRRKESSRRSLLAQTRKAPALYWLWDFDQEQQQQKEKQRHQNDDSSSSSSSYEAFDWYACEGTGMHTCVMAVGGVGDCAANFQFFYDKLGADFLRSIRFDDVSKKTLFLRSELDTDAGDDEKFVDVVPPSAGNLAFWAVYFGNTKALYFLRDTLGAEEWNWGVRRFKENDDGAAAAGVTCYCSNTSTNRTSPHANMDNLFFHQKATCRTFYR